MARICCRMRLGPGEEDGLIGGGFQPPAILGDQVAAATVASFLTSSMQEEGVGLKLQGQ